MRKKCGENIIIYDLNKILHHILSFRVFLLSKMGIIIIIIIMHSKIDNKHSMFNWNSNR